MREAKARIQTELDLLTDRERTLCTELLPDDEFARLAQLGRDLRDGTLPEI